MTDLTKQYIMADKQNSIIKVVGVGGGGGNAVNHMYNQGIEEVSNIKLSLYHIYSRCCGLQCLLFFI